MFFVLHQHREYGRTFENNVRMGGYLKEETAKRAAVRHAPAIVRNEHRVLVGQTVSSAAPNYIKGD